MSGVALAQTPPQEKPPKPAALPTGDELNKTLYAFGVLIAKNTPVGMSAMDDEQLAELKKGLFDAALKKELAVNAQEFDAKVGQFLKQRQDVFNARQKELAVKERAKGAEYAAKQAAETGAQKSQSGLVYFETQAGTGDQPTSMDTVKVHYRGTLMDGTEFDSSFKRNQPAEFPLGGVIPCWTEGVQKMKVGGKAKLICPPDIAYGDAAQPTIPAGSTLTFEVELLEVKKAPPPPAPTPSPANPAEQGGVP
ncbi:MAG: FKBP-type peptidyl-prolyl cis-trans isomerase [Myxococcaceae bacterium]|nr:FKBP-type peptidyl-prolyl cis-trans isomerase [Myxococcaceae bacterium]MCA3012689.1 FKBP-type peptidyl-prolyl cis-trans isomerase [Myxococcaceae bacterium]